MEIKETVDTCIACGKELNANNRKGVRGKWFSNGSLPWCIDCQSERFNELNKNIKNKWMTFYVCCAMYDTPYYDGIASSSENWVQYLDNLKEQKLNRNEKGVFFGFLDGEKEASKVVSGMGIPHKKKKLDMEEAKVRWGCKFSEDGVAIDYTPAEIEELDNLYNEQASEFKGNITPRVEMSLREICINRLEWKRCVGVGDSQSAKRYADMIKDAMAREGMRAGDQKPLENTRIDSLIVNLEKQGAIKDGKIIGRKELEKLLAKHHPKYSTSRDVVDEMLFAIINTMRRNNGDGELGALPPEAQVQDNFNELEDFPTESEKKAQDELGIIPPIRELS